MQQSNGYIIGFSALLTVILGGLLSLAAVGLKPAQDRQIELETKKQILSAVQPVEGVNKLELEKIYNNRVKAIVVDINGNENKNKDAKNIIVAKEYKKDKSERLYPVFKYMKEGGSSEVEYYVLPVYGYGLWDAIWGFIAIEGDLNTVKGIAMAHKSETPGLGARITDKEVQDRFKKKKIYNASGKLVAITMLKGEGNSGVDSNDNEVDGMSGATLTSDGVNAMLIHYLQCYEAYFKKQ